MVAAAKQQYKPIASFEPLSWQFAPWASKKPVMLLTGSAGGGKSTLAANKLHGFMLKYPESQGLITRKVRVSLTNSTILFMEKMVIGDDPRVVHLPSKDRFEYSNGSILSYAGLEDEKQRDRLKSIGLKGGVDICWMEEATENERADFDAVQARIRGTAAPWRQTILSTNPEGPLHWIHTDLMSEVDPDVAVFYSRAADNTYNPADYQKTLARMKGVEGLRLRDGKWVQASGLVYDVWDEEFNISEQAEFRASDPVIWFVDDGYSGEVEEVSGFFKANAHPRVFLMAQIRPDGQVCIFAESYAIHLLSDHHIRDVSSMGYPRPQFAVVDKSAAELKGRLQANGVTTINGPADVEESIKVMRNFIAPDENGYRRLLVHPRCKHFRSEMASYRRDKVSGKPVKEFDHGPDCCRYGLTIIDKGGMQELDAEIQEAIFSLPGY
jgi:phage terminase large subunit